MKMQSLRGMKDIFREEISKYMKVVNIATRLANINNYKHLITPIMESSEVFTKTLGQDSDIVSKEMYTFTDRSDKSVTLRPEFTASVARCFIQHGFNELPVKFFSYGPVFRNERPQNLRFR